ncbi:ERCC4 domain-containing protein [Belliella kenyensis]|uniref:ERCC4 domain-containing protein n=1 Tax=Belliella kenyensis TaxID=1472724 RepID=A0ABV8EHJ7_9BACT|nr:ERCC4 domain-containing protein [Belliella kenyensis]MCH7401069.1 helix-hairpin-helix domain-containing protein [Belliella kenyensis]MDN3604067.1 ERCC4 domain-containing protein [Belliella kenyensis]
MKDFLKGSKFYPLEIVIDDREPDAMLEYLLFYKNIIVRKERLLVGDFRLDSELLVERKSISDFCISLKDGRFFKQAAKLSNSNIPACIIIEGRKNVLKGIGFSKNALQAILLSVSLIFKIPVLRSKSQEETVKIMLQSFRQLTKDRLADYKFNPRWKPKFNRQKSDKFLKQKVHILEGFPGIGADKAEQLIKHFGSLQHVFNAPESELLKVVGIGKSTVEKMKMILNESS